MHFASLMLLAAVGVSAHPSGHAHQRFHQKKEVEQREVEQRGPPEVISAVIYGKLVSWTKDAGSPFKQAHKPTPAPTPAPTTSAAPAPPPAAAAPTTEPQPATIPNTGSSNMNIGGAFGLGLSKFAAFGSCAMQKRATLGQIGYKGNTGCSGFGSNMKLIQSNIADSYDYKIKVTGGNKGLDCVAFNKIGPQGLIDGFFKGNQALDFKVPAGSAQFIAVDQNTQGGVSCSPDGPMPYTPFGQFAAAWLEIDMKSAANNGWSGFDASNLVAGKYGMKQYGLKACGNGICSTLFNGGGGDNAYLPGMEDADGVGANITPGPVLIEADFGYQN